jgi:8-oxo-dGTP diphosphatase
MKTRPCAAIIVDNQLLTLKYIYSETEIYAIPGGNLEFGETLEEALIRELNEEIGVEIKIQKLLFLAEVHQPKKDTLHCVFLSELKSGIPILNPTETSALEIVWLAIDSINNYNLYPNIKNELREFVLENKDHNVFLGEISQPWF